MALPALEEVLNVSYYSLFNIFKYVCLCVYFSAG